MSQLADVALMDPVFVSPTAANVGDSSNQITNDLTEAYVLPETLRQEFVVMPAKQRLLTLIALILHKVMIYDAFIFLH